MLVELRAGNHQTIVPPSQHPSGEQITWVKDGEPARIGAPELEERVAHLAAASLLVRYYPRRGSRHYAAMALAGGLERGGWDKRTTADFIKKVAIAAHDEEADDRAKAAYSTDENLKDDKQITGWPTLAQLIDPQVVSTVREWLGMATQQSTVKVLEDNEINEINETSAPLWPELPGEAAYAGLAGRIVDTIHPHSEADPIAILVTLLAALGSAVGRGPHAKVSATRHDPRTYMALVGRTAKARKGDSLEAVLTLFRVADPEWASTCVHNGMSTGEGLLYVVRDRVEKLKEGGAGEIEIVVLDEGVEDKRLLVVEPEFARVMTVMQRSGNTLNAVIRQAWDRGDLETMTRGSALKATGAHICMVFHVTSEELRRQLTASDASNGFANRILWAMVRRSQELPDPVPFAGRAVDLLAAELRDTLTWAKGVGTMSRTPEAAELWSTVYHDLSAERDGLMWSILGRAEAQTLRLSLLYALLDRSSDVRHDHLQSALELWGYCERSVEYIFGNLTGNPHADTIYKALKTRSFEKERPFMTRTEISDLFAHNVSKADIDMALDYLRRLEKVKVATQQQTEGGRPVQIWTAIK